MVGWMLIDSKTLEPYAVDCALCRSSAADEELWEPRSRADCPVEADCEECGEYLI